MKEKFVGYRKRESSTHLANHRLRLSVVFAVAFACCVLLSACGDTNNATSEPGTSAPQPGTSTPQPGNSAPQPGTAAFQLLTVDAEHVTAVRDSLQRGDTQFRPAL